MTTEYYNASGSPSTGATLASAAVRSEFAAIAAAFALLPTMAGNGSKLVLVNAGGTALEASGALPIVTNGIAPRGYIAGLILSNNATATKLDVSAGIARDSTNAVDITLASAITAGLIQTSGAWAAGSTQNKLDTGARANSTWYHVHAIKKDSDATGDWLFSLSATAPTMPSGYTYFRRIGAVKTDGSGNIISFSQNGDEFLWTTAVADATGTSTGNTSTLITLTVPTGVKVDARVVASYYNSGAASNGTHGRVYSPDVTDEVDASHANLASPVANIYTMYDLRVRTNTSGQVRVSFDQLNNVYSLSTNGWIDTRGRYT